MFIPYFNSTTTGSCYLCSIGKAIHFVPSSNQTFGFVFKLLLISHCSLKSEDVGKSQEELGKVIMTK